MKHADLVLYVGILVLMLGLVSYFVNQGRQADTAPPAAVAGSEAVASGTAAPFPDDFDEPADAASTEEKGGWMSSGRRLLASIRSEGNRLADSIWKDGLSESQRQSLIAVQDRCRRLVTFALSGQFLIMLTFTVALLALYYALSKGKLPWLRRRSPGGKPS